MNKKIIIGIIVIIILAIGVGIWKWEKDKKIEEAKKQEIVKKENQENEIDTSDWDIYDNQKQGFSIKYPKNFAFVFQNEFDLTGNANILFYNIKYTDVAESSNPLLAILDKKLGYLRFDINGNDFVKRHDFDVKKFLTPGLSCPPGGGVCANESILEWIPINTLDGKNTLYLYTKDARHFNGDEVDGWPVRGVVWISNGKLFNIENRTDELPEDLYKEIALTFIEK